MSRRIEIYDSTLRDGAQTGGVDFGLNDKLRIAETLDKNLSLDYIEAGWPSSNPLDTAFFEKPPKLATAKLVAFTMTVKDPAKAPLALKPFVPFANVCLVGKSSKFQVENALGVSPTQNLEIITASINALRDNTEQIIFDSEHFFDGYKQDKTYALEVLQTAAKCGVSHLVLCDTNGGTLPTEAAQITSEVVAQGITGAGGKAPLKVGVHFHNDTGNAVANSILAAQEGASQIQGTFNGLGERCGNANLVTIIANLALKMGYDILAPGKIKNLTATSHLIDEMINRPSNGAAPYVGWRAFSHKAGLHASAVAKNPDCYEHTSPENVGNKRDILVSSQAGRSNILASLKMLGIPAPSPQKLEELVEAVKQREFKGYSYDNADASFELVARRTLRSMGEFFAIKSFGVALKNTGNAPSASKAEVELKVATKTLSATATGNGPVNALDSALKKALVGFYPALEEVTLVDYKVRILSPTTDTSATTRVIVTFSDGKKRWTTIGVSANVVDASLEALQDGFLWKLQNKTLEAS